MSEYRTRIDEQNGNGGRFEVHQLLRKSYALSRSATAGSGTAETVAIHLHPPHAVTARQVQILLDGGAALLEPGALQYAHGKLQVEMQKNAGAGGFFSAR